MLFIDVEGWVFDAWVTQRRICIRITWFSIIWYMNTEIDAPKRIPVSRYVAWPAGPEKPAANFVECTRLWSSDRPT